MENIIYFQVVGTKERCGYENDMILCYNLDWIVEWVDGPIVAAFGLKENADEFCKLINERENLATCTK